MASSYSCHISLHAHGGDALAVSNNINSEQFACKEEVHWKQQFGALFDNFAWNMQHASKEPKAQDSAVPD